MSVLINSKEEQLNKAFSDRGKGCGPNDSFMELRDSIMKAARSQPGNDRCCDCNAKEGQSFTVTVTVHALCHAIISKIFRVSIF